MNDFSEFVDHSPGVVDMAATLIVGEFRVCLTNLYSPAKLTPDDAILFEFTDVRGHQQANVMIPMDSTLGGILANGRISEVISSLKPLN